MTSSVNRRGFLKQSILVAGSASLVTRAASDDNKAAVTFGFSLYGMRGLSLKQALETCARIGYGAVELVALPNWPADPKKLMAVDRRALRDQLKESKVALPAIMENTPLDVDDRGHRAQLDRLKAAAELGHELAPETPPLIETILGGKPGQWDALRKQFADRLGDWARLAEQAKTVVAIKPHRLGAMNTPEQALWLAERVGSPWIKLVYDYSHFEQRDLPIADTLRVMMPQTRFVHVKDVKLTDGKVQFLLPGDGGTDYVTLFKGLREHQYHGSVCVEVSGMIHSRKDYDAGAAARHCYEKLEPAFRQAGLSIVRQ